MRALFAVSCLVAAPACLSDLGSVLESPPPNADPQLGCSLGCHGTDSSNAPPMSLAGASETSLIGVGAHRQHLALAPTWHRQVECADCHLVPAEISSPGHIDGDNRAEVVLAAMAGVAGAWNDPTCTTGCHGSVAMGGARVDPTWTQVDGSQARCGSCHGTPPPAPHPDDSNCASCHPTMEEGSLTFRDPTRHIDGVVDVTSGTRGCISCHGSAASSAPPTDLAGNSAPTAPGVGAHTAHLAASPWRREITCSSCHAVPTAVDSPGHQDGDNAAEVTFDPLNPAALYTAATTTCSNLYCHGTGRGNTGTSSWIVPATLACGACHSIDGTNMSGDHRKHIRDEDMTCSECHGDVIDAAQTIIAPALHIDGAHEVRMARGTFNAATRACSNTGCHGTETW